MTTARNNDVQLPNLHADLPNESYGDVENAIVERRIRSAGSGNPEKHESGSGR
jgi:hypothetical protein